MSGGGKMAPAVVEREENRPGILIHVLLVLYYVSEVDRPETILPKPREGDYVAEKGA